MPLLLRTDKAHLGFLFLIFEDFSKVHISVPLNDISQTGGSPGASTQVKTRQVSRVPLHPPVTGPLTPARVMTPDFHGHRLALPGFELHVKGVVHHESFNVSCSGLYLCPHPYKRVVGIPVALLPLPTHSTVHGLWVTSSWQLS